MTKASPNKNCSLCEKRRECWGEKPQRSVIEKCACMGYRYDKNIIGVYSNGKSS